jgi:hypothetical protein
MAWTTGGCVDKTAPVGPYYRYGEAISPRGDMPKNRVHSTQGRIMFAVMLISFNYLPDLRTPPAGRFGVRESVFTSLKGARP